jgi:diaminopimelate epimerase
MTKYLFKKMNGLGNSFILMNDLNNFISSTVSISKLAKAVCDVNFGIGADGLILVKKSEKNDYRMVIINADGSEAEMCGNGIRCFAKFLIDEKITDKKELNVETLAGTIKTTVKNENFVKVDMGKPIFNNDDVTAPKNDEIVKVKSNDFEFTYVSMGNPHAVTFVDNFNFNWKEYGQKVERDEKLFPNHTNVEFVTIDKENEVTMKVWERGCGETMACGTGACALVVAGVKNNKLKEGPVTVHLPGGDLHIEYHRGEPVMMTGPAVNVCHGTFLYGEQ